MNPGHADIINPAVLLTSAAFALQRVADIFDPVMTTLSARWKSAHETSAVTAADLKRAIIAAAAAFVALIATLITGLKPFDSGHPVVDALIVALAVSAGADGANSLAKGFEAAKNLVKGAALQKTTVAAGDAAAAAQASASKTKSS